MTTPVSKKSSSLCDCFKKKHPKKEETKVQIAAKPALKQYPQIETKQHVRIQSTEVITILQALREQNERQKNMNEKKI